LRFVATDVINVCRASTSGLHVCVAKGKALFLCPFSSSEEQGVRLATQPQLHTHLEKRGQPVRLEIGSCSASNTQSCVRLGYLVFRGIAGPWSMALPGTAAKRRDAVSNPSQRRSTGEVGTVEGSSPSLTTEQVERSAPLFYSDRVVSETSVSRPQHAAPGRWSGTRCQRARVFDS
jgi:hypothetical protein